MEEQSGGDIFLDSPLDWLLSQSRKMSAPTPAWNCISMIFITYPAHLNIRPFPIFVVYIYRVVYHSKYELTINIPILITVFNKICRTLSEQNLYLIFCINKQVVSISSKALSSATIITIEEHCIKKCSTSSNRVRCISSSLIHHSTFTKTCGSLSTPH